MTSIDQKASDFGIPIVWIIDNVSTEELHKTVTHSFQTIAFKAWFIIILKTKDPYVRNYFETLFFMATRKVTVISVSPQSELLDCVNAAENLMGGKPPVYIIIRDGIAIKKEVFSDCVKHMFSQDKNDLLVFTEKIPSGETVFDPQKDPFTLASFLVTKVPLSKIVENKAVNVGAVSNQSIDKLTMKTSHLISVDRLDIQTA